MRKFSVWIGVILVLVVPSFVVAQSHPSAEIFKVGFPTEVYEAAKVADEVAAKVDAAYAKTFGEMKKAEAVFRLAVEKEEDMEKFVLTHTRYVQAATAVLRAREGLGEVNMTVSRLYFKLTEVTDDLPREVIFLEWLKPATAHEDVLRLGSIVDHALNQAGMKKMLAFLKLK